VLGVGVHALARKNVYNYTLANAETNVQSPRAENDDAIAFFFYFFFFFFSAAVR